MVNMTIEEIKNIVFTPTMKSKREYLIPTDIKNFLYKTYSFCKSYSEIIYCIKNNISQCPVCPICGKELTYLKSKGRYQYHCCSSCATRDPLVRSKTMATNKQKYGVPNVFDKESPIREKTEHILLNKYGVKSMMKSPIFYEKSRKTKLDKYGDENYVGDRLKAKELAIARYGSAKNYNKIKKTMMEKYGVESFLSSDKVNSIRNNKDVQQKIQNTKRIRHTFNTSSLEEKSYEILISILGKENVKRQYKSTEYPYNCDFYVSTLNLYIECNYHWTHGRHPFNKDNDEDLHVLDIWKSKNTKYYNNAINTWTIRDVNKIKFAKLNKVNLKVFYDIDELINFIKCVSTIPDECKGVELEISTSSERKATDKVEHIVSPVGNNR